MAEEIMEKHECDWERVVEWLTGPLPGNPRVFYQKHMAHHFLDHIPRDWVSELRNVFLIRDPAAMLASLFQVIPASGLMDTGLPQQVELFEQERERTGSTPAVLDSSDLLRDPRGCLTALCETLGIEFQESMLAWKNGLRPTDGCWAEAWYGNALESTGFAPYREREVHLASEHSELAAQCQHLYERLYPHRIRT